jgi:hypothetical protein
MLLRKSAFCRASMLIPRVVLGFDVPLHLLLGGVGLLVDGF